MCLRIYVHTTHAHTNKHQHANTHKHTQGKSAVSIMPGVIEPILNIIKGIFVIPGAGLCIFLLFWCVVKLKLCSMIEWNACTTLYKLSCGIMGRRLVLLLITYILLILSGIRLEYCGTNDDNAKSHYAQQRKWIWPCDIHSICLSARRSSKTSCSTSILRAKTSSASM